MSGQAGQVKFPQGKRNSVFVFFLFQELHPLKLPPPAIRRRRKDDDDIDDNEHVRFVHCSVKYCKKMLRQVLNWSQQETQSSTLKSSPLHHDEATTSIPSLFY